LLLDCGNRRGAEFVVKPFLRSQGLDGLAALVLTHGDVHNVGGADYLLKQFRVRSVVMSPVAFRSTAYREFTGQLTTKTILERDETLGTWTVLHPDRADHFPKADDNVLVLRGNVGATRILLLSDLGKPGQSALLERYSELHSDLVISGVPNGSEPLSDGLLEAVEPLAIVVTDSLYPATARAGARLRERLGRQAAPVFYTSDTGAVTLVLGREEWRMETATGGVLLRGRGRGAP
jgi:beta-lactamase superfamily II metal-dependent hydrolase